MNTNQNNKSSSNGQKNNLQAKKNKLSEVTRIANSLAREVSDQNAGLYANALISPKETGPVIFPSPTPSRCGAALFPLVVEVTVPTDFGIVVRPSLTQPLSITSDAALADSADPIYGAMQIVNTSMVKLETDTPCKVQQQKVDGIIAMPLVTSAGATINVAASLQDTMKSGNYILHFMTHDSVSGLWTTHPGVFNNSISHQVVNIIANLVIATTIDYYSFSISGATPSVNVYLLNYNISVNVGLVSCAPLGFGLRVYMPDWGLVLQASQRARVVAMDCLVTFEGSSLNNGGSIAVCNTDDELSISSNFYNTIASRPHDMYRGRLASEGETEGGGHWHYVPDSLEQLAMQDATAEVTDPQQVPYGYFGIQGKSAGEVVRIEVHLMINFYSFDPSFVMSIQPPMTDFPALLYALRSQVDLVSSNDSHLNKIKKLMKKGIRGGVKFSKDHSADIAKALSLLATV